MGISVLPMRSQSFFCFFHACSHDSNQPPPSQGIDNRFSVLPSDANHSTTAFPFSSRVMPNRFLPCWSLMRTMGSPSGLVLRTIKAGLFGGATSMRWALMCSKRVEASTNTAIARATVTTVKTASQRRRVDNCCSTDIETNPFP